MTDLVMKNISKFFGAVQALADANFEAKFGEVHALLGENGAGKSTLMKILSGTMQPNKGEIYLKGKQLKISKPHDAVVNGIGTVYQELSLVPNLTVSENMFLNTGELTWFQTIKKKENILKTKAVLEQFAIDGVKPTDIVKNLSLPFRQMIEIAKVLARNPEVIVMDEATSALSDDKVQWLLKIARGFAEKGKIVIFISHRMSEIRTCDRITIFRSGTDVGVRKNTETNSDELVSMMLGRKISTYFPQKTDHSMEDAALEMRNINLGNLLKDINLTLKKGMVMGVGGLAGQGQSALFQVLSGVLQPSGEILIKGKTVKMKSPYQSQNCGIGLIPEDRGSQGLIMSLSIGENIQLPVLGKMKKFGVFTDTKRLKYLVKSSMERFAVKAPNEDIIATQLSGGNQQKVIFAKVLALLPEVILMFDCTRGVDVGTKVEIFNMVRELAKNNHSILYYSTDVEELVNICDKVFIMHDGKISAMLEEENLSNENIILALMGEKIQDSIKGDDYVASKNG
ncbi:MAG: sugar ABC transporter ATP-binding protein [Treponema sp.]|jgi:ABC-type sugar transport system ATPase subunit|nr:sugar ABC transporter ATP-binding protein [Treponema sp.]